MTGPAEPRLRLREGALEWRVLEQETVILDLHGARYFAVNATGTVLWPMLAEGATQAELVDAVTRTWEIEHRQAARDVAAFCARLHAAGLLEA